MPSLLAHPADNKSQRKYALQQKKSYFQLLFVFSFTKLRPIILHCLPLHVSNSCNAVIVFDVFYVFNRPRCVHLFALSIHDFVETLMMLLKEAGSRKEVKSVGEVTEI